MTRAASLLKRFGAVALLAVTVATGVQAIAQPTQPPGGQPPPAGQPAPQPRMQPGPPRQPGPQPGMPPGRPMPSPNQPRPLNIPRDPGADPRKAAEEARRAAEEAKRKAEEEEHLREEIEHGAPQPINWWRGMFMASTDPKYQTATGIEALIWRYEDPSKVDPKNTPAPLLAQIMNFGIVVLILLTKGRKPIVEGLIKRKQTLMADINAAEALRAESEARLKKYDRDLKNIAARQSELEEEYRAQAAIDKKRILREAEEKRARMIKDAEFRIQQEMRQAETDLTKEAVDAAIAAAEELIKKRVDQKDMDRLADDYLANLGGAIRGSAIETRGGAA